MDEVEGIIVSETNYSETSKIINIITKEYGLIGVLAKGSKSLKSPFRASTSKLTYAKFNIYYKKDKLSLLKEVNIINNFKNIKKDINKISYSAYLLELSEGVIKQSHINEVYNLLIDGLLKIEEGFDPLVILNIIELKYLKYLGIEPILDRCSICGNANNIKTLSCDKGGYICSNCYKNEYICSTKTIKLIRMFYYVDVSKISNLNISEEAKKEINKFLSDYYDKYTGLYLKSKKFIQNLQKLEN